MNDREEIVNIDASETKQMDEASTFSNDSGLKASLEGDDHFRRRESVGITDEGNQKAMVNVVTQSSSLDSIESDSSDDESLNGATTQFTIAGHVTPAMENAMRDQDVHMAGIGVNDV